MFFLDQLTSVKETRSLDDIFLFRESEKGLKKTPGVSFFINNLQGPKKEINQNQGEWPFFVNLVPQAQKRVKLIPENTLLANRSS
jgi:hypothetical protein